MEQLLCCPDDVTSSWSRSSTQGGQSFSPSEVRRRRCPTAPPLTSPPRFPGVLLFSVLLPAWCRQLGGSRLHLHPRLLPQIIHQHQAGGPVSHSATPFSRVSHHHHRQSWTPTQNPKISHRDACSTAGDTDQFYLSRYASLVPFVPSD